MTSYNLDITLFQFWTIVPCPVLTAASWSEYSFLRRQVRRSGILVSLRIFQFVVIHTAKGFSVVNEAEVDFFLFPCIFYDAMGLGNLISGPTAFSKSSLYIWNFSVQVPLKSSLKDFNHNLTSMQNDHNCSVACTWFGHAPLWDWNENWPFPFLWPRMSFPNLMTYWVQHFNRIIF